MDSLAEQRIRGYLRNRLRYDPYDCGAVLFHIRQLARTAGYCLDERFGHAGLSAGPEGSIASSIVDQALGGGSGATSRYAMKAMIDRWIQTTGAKGM